MDVPPGRLVREWPPQRSEQLTESTRLEGELADERSRSAAAHDILGAYRDQRPTPHHQPRAAASGTPPTRQPGRGFGAPVLRTGRPGRYLGAASPVSVRSAPRSQSGRRLHQMQVHLSRPGWLTITSASRDSEAAVRGGMEDGSSSPSR